MKRIFITGGTGFIGKHILNLLKKDKNVHCYVLTRNAYENSKNISYLQGNIADMNVIKHYIERINPQYLLHLAWDVSKFDYANAGTNYVWVQWTEDLVTLFLKNGGKHVIVSGTCLEYSLFTNIPHKEDEICISSCLYGKCKLEVYEFLLKICNLYNARLVWGRIFYPYGKDEDQRKLISNVIQVFQAGMPFICKTPNDKIDFIQIDDLAKLFRLAIFNKNLKGIINFGTGNGVYIRDIVNIIARKMNQEKLAVFEDNTGKNVIADITKLRLYCRMPFKAVPVELMKGL